MVLLRGVVNFEIGDSTTSNHTMQISVQCFGIATPRLELIRHRKSLRHPIPDLP